MNTINPIYIYLCSSFQHMYMFIYVGGQFIYIILQIKLLDFRIFVKLFEKIIVDFFINFNAITHIREFKSIVIKR